MHKNPTKVVSCRIPVFDFIKIREKAKKEDIPVTRYITEMILENEGLLHFIQHLESKIEDLSEIKISLEEKLGNQLNKQNEDDKNKLPEFVAMMQYELQNSRHLKKMEELNNEKLNNEKLKEDNKVLVRDNKKLGQENKKLSQDNEKLSQDNEKLKKISSVPQKVKIKRVPVVRKYHKALSHMSRLISFNEVNSHFKITGLDALLGKFHGELIQFFESHDPQ